MERRGLPAPAVLLAARIFVRVQTGSFHKVLLHLAPHLQILLGERGKRLHGILCETPAQFILLFCEKIEALFEIPGENPLHVAAVKADQLREHIRREQGRPRGFFLNDDLDQDLSGDVFLAVGIDNLELNVLQHHVAHVGHRDVLAGFRVVEPAVGILLDDAFAHAASQGRLICPG